MDSRQFYEFSSKLMHSAVQVYPFEMRKSRNYEDSDKLIYGNYEGINFPIIFKYEDGKNWCDLLDTGLGSLYLVSDRMKAIFEENQFTGWRSFPTRVYDKKDNEISGYHGLSFLGRASKPTYDERTIIEEQYAPNASIARYYIGLTFDEWDGSDFFVLKDTLMTSITKRVADELKKHKFTNLELTSFIEIKDNVRNVPQHFKTQ